MPLVTENTTFTRDVFGRYTCNTLQEALDSTTNGGKPFDVVIIGGGSFGGVMAHRLFQLDSRLRQHRILVLEGGPFLVPEHIQNLPTIGDVFGEVKRVPWQPSPASPTLTFPGLAYCLAGRSLFWGGWSPQLTDSELASWPAAVVKDMKDIFFTEAKRQLGTDAENDFIFGPLHDKLRARLFAGIGSITNKFGINTAQDLEAPLAVVSASVRAGTFPINKFSSMPLLMDAARKSWVESNGDDRKKRLMIVANCTVQQLGLTGNKVTLVKTNLGDITVPPNGTAVIALGTIESTRLALRSFPNTNQLIGCNLMAHLRSNFTLRIPRRSLSIPPDKLYASTLFVKGKSTHGHFHLQITASSAGPNETNSEAELFRKVPDIDTLDSFDLNDEFVIITLRGIGEMTPEHKVGSKNRVDLVVAPSGTQAAPTAKAQVTLLPSATDTLLWNDLDAMTDEVAGILAGGQPYEVNINNSGNPNDYRQVIPGQAGKEARDVFPYANRHDNLGTTHHEAGTLWMDSDPAKGVTDLWGRVHEIPNAWVVGPALFPTAGSPNPMLTGVALVRRAAERLIEKPIITAPSGQVPLFDGVTLNGWTQAGAGNFVVDNGTLRSQGGLGLLWYSLAQFRDFELSIDWKITKIGDNSGVFIRFPDPNGDPFNAVREGYEVQIDDLANPDGAMIHQTGAIYDVQPPLVLAANPAGQWNTYIIRVVGQTYNVTLNGQVVINNFIGNRSSHGFIGLQNHLQKDVVFFRNIIVTPL